MLLYLIDDDFISLFTTEQVLRLEGFATEILPFLTAEAALAHLLPRLGTEVPALILLDLNMPVRNGWDFLDALAPHAEKLQGVCSIYLLTSSLALADTERAQVHALVKGIIHKPLDQGDLNVIVTALYQREGQRGTAPPSSYSTSPPPCTSGKGLGKRTGLSAGVVR